MENSDVFRLDGHTLRLFVSLCETCSVTQTANAFGLNQSTVSYALEKMRSAVGDPLFVRDGRGIAATEKSLLILPRIKEVLASLEGLCEAETYDPQHDKESVSIAIATPALLPEVRNIQRALHGASPNRKLDVRRLGPRHQITNFLDRGDADLAITIRGVSYPIVLNHLSYGCDELVVFYDPSQRAPIWSLADYQAARHVVTGFGDASPSIVETALAAEGVTRDIALVAPTTALLGELILGTDLIATMPKSLARSVYRNLAFSTPPLDLPMIEYHLVWHRRYEYSARNIWLRELVLDARDATHFNQPEEQYLKKIDVQNDRFG